MHRIIISLLLAGLSATAQTFSADFTTATGVVIAQ
jgi:hypothetical protein